MLAVFTFRDESSAADCHFSAVAKKLCHYAAGRLYDSHILLRHDAIADRLTRHASSASRRRFPFSPFTCRSSHFILMPAHAAVRYFLLELRDMHVRRQNRQTSASYASPSFSHAGYAMPHRFLIGDFAASPPACRSVKRLSLRVSPTVRGWRLMLHRRCR